MSELLRVIGDQPADQPKLGFEHFAKAIASAVKGGEPPQFTIGLYGPWGCGKSSLLNAVGRELAMKPTNCVVVKFDAWRYQPGGEMIASLLAVIAEEVKHDKKFERLTKSLLSCAIAMLRGTRVTISATPSVELDGETIIDGLVPEQAPSILGASQLVGAMRRDAKALKDTRVVVLIDDLDRCTPSNLVGVLETINNVMDIHGFVFVLALDYEVLVNAIAHEYPHVSGHEFIEKMVQIPFRVPPLDLDAEDLLRDLLPNWLSLVASTSEAFDKVLVNVIRVALRGNPRQTKRLVNTFQVLRQIFAARGGVVDDSLLVTVLGMQFGWPEDYARLQSILVLEKIDSVDALLSRIDGDSPSPMSALLRQALGNEHNLSSLVSAIHLATTAAPQSDADRGEIVLGELVGFLLANGWSESIDEEQVWYPNEGIKDWQLVRIANRSGRVSLEMRERVAAGKGNRSKPVYQTITHYSMVDAMRLCELAARLTVPGELQRWRQTKLQERRQRVAQ